MAPLVEKIATYEAERERLGARPGEVVLHPFHPANAENLQTFLRRRWEQSGEF